MNIKIFKFGFNGVVIKLVGCWKVVKGDVFEFYGYNGCIFVF